MSNREKFLGLAVLGLVALWGLKVLYARHERAQQIRQTQLRAAEDERNNLKLTLRAGERAVRQMEGWQQRSLPANREKALSLYKAWLLETAEKSGLKVDDIKPAARPAVSSGFSAIGYQLEASGALTNIVKMLYAFYSSPQLQQITRLRLTRPVGRSELQVSLEAEALILKGAKATDSLPEGQSNRLKLASLEAYQKSLGDRDLASVYTPPRPPRDTTARAEPPAPPKFDDADQARFSGSVGVGGKYQAWIHVRTTGETLHLSAGDSFKVGQLEGQVVSVEQRSLVYQAGEKKYRVSLDQSLRKGTEITADGNSARHEGAEVPKS